MMIVFCMLFLFLGIEVIGEADANVMVAEVAPRGGLLVGGLVGTEAVLVVEDILELQAQFGFVLENLPRYRAIPQ